LCEEDNTTAKVKLLCPGDGNINTILTSFHTSLFFAKWTKLYWTTV